MRALIFVLCLFFPVFSQAATFYVSTTGSDSTGNGSSANPWASLQKCNDSASVVSGDTCQAKDGTYTTTSTGALLVVSKANLTFKSENYLGAKLNGQNNFTGEGISIATSPTTIEGFEIYGFGNHGLVGTVSNLNGVTVRRNNIHDIGRQCTTTGQGQDGFFFGTGSANFVIEENVFHNIGRFISPENGCSVTTPDKNDHAIYSGAVNGLTIKRNLFYDINRGFSVQLSPVAQSNIKILNNVFADATPASRGNIVINTAVTNVDISNNIFHNPGAGPIDSVGGATYTNVTTHNNLVTNNVGCLWSAGPNCIGTPSGVTDSGNLFNQSAQFTNASGRNYTLTVSSPAIDAGFDVSLPFNGSKPDIGIFETFIFSSCVVENGDASTVRITFSNNTFPPLLPATGVTGFTARKNGVNDTVTSASRTGTNRIDLTLQTPIANGDTVQESYSSGNLTDSTFSGGTTNQPYVSVANQSCTNNVAAAGTQVYTQTVFRFNGLRGTEAAPVATPYATAPENTNIFIIKGGSVRLRVGISCTVADCPPVGILPYYSRNGGTYTVIPDTFGSDNIAFCGTSPDPDIPLTGTSTTQQLSGSGTFTPGALIRTSNAVNTIDMVLNGRTEVEWCLSVATGSGENDSYNIRAYQQDGTALVYNVTPNMKIVGISKGGF